jgi:hypothetical protein
MDSRVGWVRLYRALMDHPVWTQLSPVVLKVAVHFLLTANYKPGEWYDGARMVSVPAGSFITSNDKMAIACRLSVQQIRGAFDHLERTQFATYLRTHRWTLVTIKNWDTYQTAAEDGNTPDNSFGTGKTTTNKEEKKKTTHTSASPGGDDCEGARTPDTPQSARGQGAPSPGRANSRGAGGLTAQQEAWFCEWWAAYWRRVAKKDAREAFGKHVATETRFREIMAATRAQSPGMLAKELRFQLLGASWLNGERWLDEVTDQQQQPKNDDYPKFDL